MADWSLGYIWKKYQQSEPAERQLLCEAYFTIQLISIGLHLLGFRYLYNKLGNLIQGNPQISSLYPNWTKIYQVSDMVENVSRRSLIPVTCLSRSLSLWYMLNKRNISTELRIGIKHQGNKILAHAWIELDRRVINDDESIAIQYLAFDQAILPKEAILH